VTVFERNRDGVVAVRFKAAADAARCVQTMNGRFFDRRRIEAFFFDGKTDYRYRESEEEQTHRMKEWRKFLGDEGSESDADG